MNTIEQAHDAYKKVTPRQMEIIRAAIEGKNTREIAAEMGITVNTVESHRHTLLKNTGCRNMVQVAAIFVRSGVIA